MIFLWTGGRHAAKDVHLEIKDFAEHDQTGG
jgi:hypothetical protein